MSGRATKAWPEPLNAQQMALLRAFRRLTPRDQLSAIHAAQQVIDGQPIEDALIELGIEFGDTPEQARERAQQAIGHDIKWREMLD